jgi:AraC-like DNA-binding protein
VAGTGMDAVPVHRVSMTTRDMDVIAALNQRYVEHQARLRCADPARIDAGVRAAVTSLLEVAIVRHQGFDYYCRGGPPDDFLSSVMLHGTGTVATSRERRRFAHGDVLLVPADETWTADMHDSAFAMLRISRQAVGELAEEHTGLPAASLRFESIAPLSASGRALWAQTVAFLCRGLVSSGITEISPLVAQELTRLAATALLDAFPNTAMSAPYLGGPGQVTPAAVRRAAAFMDTHAGRPVTVTEVAAVAGTTPRALQYAFRRHYDTTPMGYLRRIRLERAHRQLEAADPATGATVAKIARSWGWANPAQFATVYRKRYGLPPSHTLRG